MSAPVARPQPLPVEFYNRHGKKLRSASYLDIPSALAAIETHLLAHTANIVKIKGQLAFTLDQAARRVRAHFQGA